MPRIVLLVLSIIALVRPLAAAEASRPNFVFILADDLRWDALGCQGNRIVQTPNIDALAARGVRFTNSFVTTSICCTSRRLSSPASTRAGMGLMIS
jgi:arylsulfatase A-like enzyme